MYIENNFGTCRATGSTPKSQNSLQSKNVGFPNCFFFLVGWLCVYSRSVQTPSVAIDGFISSHWKWSLTLVCGDFTSYTSKDFEVELDFEQNKGIKYTISQGQ